MTEVLMKIRQLGRMIRRPRKLQQRKGKARANEPTSQQRMMTDRGCMTSSMSLLSLSHASHADQLRSDSASRTTGKRNPGKMNPGARRSSQKIVAGRRNPGARRTHGGLTTSLGANRSRRAEAGGTTGGNQRMQTLMVGTRTGMLEVESRIPGQVGAPTAVPGAAAAADAARAEVAVGTTKATLGAMMTGGEAGTPRARTTSGIPKDRQPSGSKGIPR
mmetsp:Transcript_45239/g.79650  ORF Transcript_45239/g.79650 Transcript_45239/m.79650 type:complete len:218 (+) Transcript_45239:546-1199(+)